MLAQMTNGEQLKALLDSPKNIVISGHVNPDADALGSTLALYHYLQTLGHRVQVIMPSELPQMLDFMPGFHLIWNYERKQKTSNATILQADILFSLDYSALDRLDSMESVWRKATGYKVLIDHHMQPEDFAQSRLWRTSSSSTAELVYDYFAELGALEQVPLMAFECLYVGILGDTGRFQHATNAHLFRIIADMTERGLNSNYITNMMTNSFSEKKMRLLGHCINKMSFLEGLDVGYIALSQAEHQEFNIQRGDLEGVVNTILQIRRIKVAALITERKDRVKLSLRSKGDFSVQEVCKNHFNGGGHRNASGGMSRESLEETLNRFKRLMNEDYASVLRTTDK